MMRSRKQAGRSIIGDELLIQLYGGEPSLGEEKGRGIRRALQ